MGNTPPEVMQRELDTAWQNVFTYASWAIVVVMLVIAWRMCVKQRTPFYIIAMLAAGVAAFGEPLYDVAFDLWFYDADSAGNPGVMHSHFTAFEVVQPNWSHSGYMILYANAVLYAGRKIYNGTFTRKNLYIIFGIELATSCLFEVIGTGVGVYTYWGPHEFRIWNYPLVIGVLEAAQVITFTVIAVLLWRKVATTVGLLGLFVLFPVTFFGVNFGIGSPTIIALHLNDPETTGLIVGIASLLSMAMALLLVNGVSRFLPTAPADAPAPAGPDAPVAERERSKQVA